MLDHVLALHPDYHLTIPDLVCEMPAGSADLGEGDQLERAVRDLVGKELLDCQGGLVVPTQAAGLRWELLQHLLVHRIASF